MATDKRTGPLLRVEGSCEGCEHLHHRSERGVPFDWTCGAWAEKSIGYSLAVVAASPAWCPELSAARLALARGIVAEAPCGTALVRQTGGNLPCAVKGEHVEHRSACGRRWGGEDFSDHPDFDSRAFCDDGSNQ